MSNDFFSNEEHWLSDETARKRFWAAAGELALTNEQVHMALADDPTDPHPLESVYDFEGTEQEAMDRLRGYACNAPTVEGFIRGFVTSAPEAPMLAWTQIQLTPNGPRWTVSLRPVGLSTVELVSALGTLRTTLELFERGMDKFGWQAIHRDREYPATSVDPGELMRGRQALTSPPTQAPPTQAPPPQPRQAQGTLTFPAKTLVGSFSDDKVYWKVKGGRFMQYGVTIWPEVLEAAGFQHESLNPMTTYDLSGFTASYIENDSGNPQKVVSLSK